MLVIDPPAVMCGATARARQQKAERDFMFNEKQRASANFSSYSALEKAKTLGRLLPIAQTTVTVRCFKRFHGET